jgi:hypothetical protein
MVVNVFRRCGGFIHIRGGISRGTAFRWGIAAILTAGATGAGGTLFPITWSRVPLIVTFCFGWARATGTGRRARGVRITPRASGAAGFIALVTGGARTSLLLVTPQTAFIVVAFFFAVTVVVVGF